jgi:hypothetical protein
MIEAMSGLASALALAFAGGFAALLGGAPGVGQQAVPSNLQPPLAQVRRVLPQVYSDGCHVDDLGTQVPRCVYGDPHGKVTIVLFGDSHASQWFPPIQTIATRRRLRLVSLTHSHCPAPLVRIWGQGGVPCDRWRRAALRRIARVHPDLVIVGSLRTYTLADPSGARVAPAAAVRLWRDGYVRVIRRLEVHAPHVALLTDSEMAVDVPDCLRANLTDVALCSTPRSVSINPANAALERAVAARTGTRLIDTVRWTCPTNPCPAIIGRTLVWRDDDHLTPAITEEQEPRLLRVLNGLLAPAA